MKTRNFRSLAGTALLCALVGSAAHAQGAFFASNAVISYVVNGDAVVGYGSFNDYLVSINGTSPTVSLVNGGNISGDLDVLNNSVANVTGGIVNGGLFAYDSSTINVSGGSIGTLAAFGSNTVNISGGSISGNLNASNSSTLNFFGSLTDTPVNSNVIGYSEYALFGVLADGTALNGRTFYVQNGTGAGFTLNPAAVPEPSSVALLVGIASVGAGVGVLRKRRK